MPITIKPKVHATKRYETFLKISSLFLAKPLTKVEVNILDELYFTGGELNSDVRKLIKDALDMSAEQLNNYIKVLRAKKVIVGDRINPSLMISIPEEDHFMVEIDMRVVA